MNNDIVCAKYPLVTHGGYLDIDSSTVQGCLTMWRGITVEDLGELIIQEGSTVADGDTTILAHDKAKIKIYNAYFRNFVLGVYMPPKAGALYNGTTFTVQQATFEFTAFKPDYTGQNPHGLKSQCGILLNDWIGTIGTYIQDYWLNKFINLHTGVVGIGSLLTVKNCFFENIQKDNFYTQTYSGTNIFNRGNPLIARAGSLTVQPVMNNNKTMVNCDYGVWANYSNLDIQNVRMDSMTVGVYAMQCKDYLQSKILYNEIKANTYGLMLVANSGAANMQIEGNRIYMKNGAFTAILLNEFNPSGHGNYIINNNSIYLDGASNGILMLNTFKPVLKHNYIEQNGTSVVQGITALGCDSTYLTCNQVRAMDITNTVSKGIYFSISQNGTIACNFIDTTATGIFIGGNCAGTQLKGNTMRNNMLGLYINNVGLIGVQNNNGNKFIDYRDTIGAYNANLSQFGLSGSEFRVRTTDVMGNIYYPVLAQQNTGWFNPILTTSPFQCGNTCYDMLEYPDNELLYRIIADDSILTEEFIPESQSMARQYLFSVLENNPELRESDTLFLNFYNTMLAEAEGQLKEVERRFETYGKMDSTFIPMLNNVDSLTALYNYYIEHFDEMRDSIEQTGINPDSLREQWIFQIENLDVTRINIVMQHNAVITGEMYEGELTNNLIQPEEVPEYNSARMNEIFMILEEGNYSDIDEFYNELMSIASECPYYGGEGVYRARAMLYLINDTLQYNDDANCLLYGFYRQGNLSDKYSDETKISIKPNPANTFVRIRVSCSENEMFTAKIINAVGQEVLETNLQCNKDNVISTANFQQGIYTVTVKTNSKIQSFKLSIIR